MILQHLSLILNISMFAVALPFIKASLGLKTDTVSWLVTAYSLPAIMLMPVYGKLSDVFGMKKLLLLSQTLIFTGTALFLFSGDHRFFLLGRMIQGCGAAGIAPLCLAAINRAFAEDTRSSSLSRWNAAGPGGFLLGTLTAGILIGITGWKAIFIVVLIICAISSVLTLLFIPGRPKELKPLRIRSFDFPGMMLLILFMTSFIFFLSSRPITGRPPFTDLRLLAAAIMVLFFFLYWEKRIKNPLFPLPLFKVPNFSVTSFVMFLYLISIIGIGFLLPLVLTEAAGASPFFISLALMAHSGTAFLVLSFGRQFSSRFHQNTIFKYCFIIQGFCMALIPFCALSVPELVFFPVVLHAVATGLTIPLLHNAAVRYVPPGDIGTASGVYIMIHSSGDLIGVAVSGTIIAVITGIGGGTGLSYCAAYAFIAAVSIPTVVLAAKIR